MKEVVKKEVLKWLNAEFIYAISNSPWVSPMHVVPKNGGMTVIKNEKNESMPTVDPTRSTGRRDSLLNEKKMWVDFEF